MVKKLNGWLYILNIVWCLIAIIILIIKKDLSSETFWSILIIGNIWIAAWNVKNDLEEELWKNIETYK